MTGDELADRVGENVVKWVRPLVGYVDSHGLLWRDPEKGYGHVEVLETDDVCLSLVRLAELFGMDLEIRRRGFVPLHVNVWLAPRKGA